jgi:hypothetical protein
VPLTIKAVKRFNNYLCFVAITEIIVFYSRGSVNNVNFSDPNPVSVSLIFQPMLNAETPVSAQFQHKKNLAENKLQN